MVPLLTVIVKLAEVSAVPETKVPPDTVIVGAVVYPEPGLVTKFNAVGNEKPICGATV